MPTALIAGATGLIGRQLVDLLLEDPGAGELTALARRPLVPSHPRLNQLITDFDQLESLPLPEVETFICCLGTTRRAAGTAAGFHQVDYDYPLRLARRLREAGTRRCLLVSSVGANPGSPSLYLRTKGELERDLAALDFDSLHIFRPGLLLGRRGEPRPGEEFARQFAPLVGLLMLGPLRRLRPVPAAEVARALAVTYLNSSPGSEICYWEQIHQLAARIP